ncbi:uncharacterized protein LOC131876938 isoform X2 [Tigriopus californicus]|nr:uncharacterized protein LOC131876938 isoform X2 [Tigriopus californicus]
MKPVPDSTAPLGPTNETPMSETHPDEETEGASSSSILNSISTLTTTTNEGDDEDFKKLSGLAKGGGSGTKRAHVVGAAFDRLKPRSFSDGSKRLCMDERGSGSGTGLTSSSASPCCSNPGTESRDWCSEAKKSKKFQKEYGKLRHLVPALSERDDLSKVEIVEETIRYIDALHHQLASRIDPSVLTAAIEDQQNSTSDIVHNAPEPLRTVSSSDCQPQQTRPSSQRGSAHHQSPNSGSLDSPSDLKAAVENIQAMFSAYLQQQQPSNNAPSDQSPPESEASSGSSRANEEPS